MDKKTIKVDVWWSPMLAGEGGHEVIEVDADASDARIEAEAKETAMQHFEWGYDILGEEA